LNNTGVWITQNFKYVSIDMRLKGLFDFIYKSWNYNKSIYDNFLEIRTKIDFLLLQENWLLILNHGFSLIKSFF
jgi:hypothetical protein